MRCCRVRWTRRLCVSVQVRSTVELLWFTFGCSPRTFFFTFFTLFHLSPLFHFSTSPLLHFNIHSSNYLVWFTIPQLFTFRSLIYTSTHLPSHRPILYISFLISVHTVFSTIIKRRLDWRISSISTLSKNVIQEGNFSAGSFWARRVLYSCKIFWVWELLIWYSYEEERKEYWLWEVNTLSSIFVPVYFLYATLRFKFSRFIVVAVLFSLFKSQSILIA